MLRNMTKWSSVLFASASVAALAVGSTGASAGGFEIREQSTVFMGSAYAGAAAGGSISSMYFNPAAAAQYSGLNTESSYTLVVPQGDVHITGGSPAPTPPINLDSGNVGIDAVTSASYGTYQLSKDLWVGIGINSPFGLATKPNPGYLGNVLGVTTKLLTVNANPTLAYRIAPGVTIGAGIQIEYGRAKLQFAEPIPGTPSSAFPIAQFKGTDVAIGATAGILIEPARGTSIGLGYRSRLSHDFDGHLDQPLAPGGPATFSAVGSVDLPDIVTLSIRQDISPITRLLGTVEWTNWSQFNKLTLSSVGVGGSGILTIPANWHDGWFFSLGGEYDYSRLLTLRAGAAYEISPEANPSERLPAIPDNDRVWLSIGGSYKYSEATTIDFGYSHIFVQDGAFSRTAVATPLVKETGTITDASADLISVGMRTRW